MVKVINIDTVTKTIRIGNADGDIKTWRTTESGTHFPIREGESTKEALDKFLEKKGKRYYRGSVLHKDIIDDLGKASAKSDENVKYWESEVGKENKRKRKTPGYLDFAQKNIEAWKAQAETQRAKAKELSGDFEIDPDDADLNKEFEEWKKSKQPAGKSDDIMSWPFHKAMELPADDPRLEKYLKAHFTKWKAAKENDKIEALKDKVVDGIAGDVGSQDYTQLVSSALDKELAELEKQQPAKDDSKSEMDKRVVDHTGSWWVDTDVTWNELRKGLDEGKTIGNMLGNYDDDVVYWITGELAKRTGEKHHDLYDLSEDNRRKYGQAGEYIKRKEEEKKQLADLRDNYGVEDDKDLMKAIEDHYVNQVAFYGKDSKDAKKAKYDYRKAAEYLHQKPKSHDEMMQGRTIEFEPDLPAKEPAKEPAKSKPMGADQVKQTMQKTMESFPRLYSWEKPHLEKFADDIWSELEKNPGKEQEILDEWVEAYDDAAKRLGMWVDTPTLAKRDFLQSVAESWKSNSGTQGQQSAKTASAPEKSESTGDVHGSYENAEAIRQELWDKGYATDNEGDGDYGDTGTEYVWKDGTMYAVDITKNPDGSVSAKQSSMGEVSRSEFNDYLDEIHGDDDDDEDEDDETDSDISGIESRGEAANWLNAMTRKHGNTYFWSGNMKSALNKLVEKFGNTYFWNK